METQKIVNLLNSSENEYSKFSTKKWYVIYSEAKSQYSHRNPIKPLIKPIEPSLCDYPDAYILVTGNITVTGGNANTKVAFKNCAPVQKCSKEVNGPLADEVDFINIVMPMYNLIEYSDNYSDTSSLWQFKRDEIDTNANVCNTNISSFKCRSSLIGNLVADGADGKKEKVKIIVPLKYLSNFWRSLEMPLINCRVELSLRWIENCVFSGGKNINNEGAVTNARQSSNLRNNRRNTVPIVTVSTEDHVKLSKLLSEGFRRSVYSEKYKTIPNKNEVVTNENPEYMRELLDPSYQGVKSLFFLLMII